jgi:threonine dehydratase
MHHRLKLDNIRTAARAIDPVFLNSPQYLADSLSRSLGTKILVKVETANPFDPSKVAELNIWHPSFRRAQD